MARFSEKCFVRGEKKPDFFNPFPKKIQGIHTKTLNCGGVYGKLIVSKLYSFAGELNCPGFGVWQGGEASGWKCADSTAQDRFFKASERKRKSAKPLKHLQKRG